jgi:hypothetical protein
MEIINETFEKRKGKMYLVRMIREEIEINEQHLQQREEELCKLKANIEADQNDLEQKKIQYYEKVALKE